MLGFEDLRIGDFAYIRDDLECGKSYGKKTFVSGSQGMKKGAFIEIFGLKPDSIGNDCFWYSREMIDLSKSMKRGDYFKKKEQSQQYTFDDLIDVAVQAVKDKVINGANIRLHEIGFMHNKTHYKLMPAFDCKEQIDLIKSLYKEIFVIETEEDIQKIQAHRKSDLPLLDEQMSKAILENGNEILIFRVDSESPHVCRYMRNGLYMNYLDIEVLKGATVEQERGRDDRS